MVKIIALHHLKKKEKEQEGYQTHDRFSATDPTQSLHRHLCRSTRLDQSLPFVLGYVTQTSCGHRAKSTVGGGLPSHKEQKVRRAAGSTK